MAWLESMDEAGSTSHDDGSGEICLNLYDHLIEDSNPERFSCPGCEQELAKRNWILHAKENFSCQSNPAKRRIKCPGCERKFVLRERMVEHYSSKHAQAEIEAEILEGPEEVQEFLEKLHKEGGVMFSSRSTKKGVHHYKCKLEDRLRFDRDPPNENRLFDVERKVETCTAFAISTPRSNGTYYFRYCNHHSHDVRTPTKTITTSRLSEFGRSSTKRKNATSDFINAEDLLPKDDSRSIVKQREYHMRLRTEMPRVPGTRLPQRKDSSGTTECIEHLEHDCFVWHDYERSTTERRMKHIYQKIAAREVHVKEEPLDDYTQMPQPLVKIEPELVDEDVKPCI